MSGLIDGTTADGVETYLSVLFDDDKVNSVVMLGGGTARAEVVADDKSKWLGGVVASLCSPIQFWSEHRYCLE